MHFPLERSAKAVAFENIFNESLMDFLALHDDCFHLLFGDSNIRTRNREDQCFLDLELYQDISIYERWDRSMNPDGDLNNRDRMILNLFRIFDLLITNGRCISYEFTRYT